MKPSWGYKQKMEKKAKRERQKGTGVEGIEKRKKIDGETVRTLTC